MRRLAGVTLLFLAACGGGPSTPGGESVAPAPASAGGPCAATSDDPFGGLAAVKDDGSVTVFRRRGDSDRFEIGRLGDDPRNPPTQGDGSFVETVAVVPSASCGVFVALCCEPASGLTKWFATPGAEPVDLYGRLPAVSPDGMRVALAGYDVLSVTSTADPLAEGSTIGLPGAGSGVVLDMMWLDNDRLVLLVNSDGDVLLHEAVVSEGTMRPGRKLAAGPTGVSALLVGLVDGKLLVNERAGSALVTESFDPATLESVGSKPGDPAWPYVRRSGKRTAAISREGVLSAWTDGDADPTRLGAGYWWAG